MSAPLVEWLALEFLFLPFVLRLGPFGRMVFAQFGTDLGLDRIFLEWPQQYRLILVRLEQRDGARRLRFDRPRHVWRWTRRKLNRRTGMLNKA